ncbi:hypothetical protein P7H50_14130 [Enterococcus durans]|uniref:hypothetical protein n=1 Tax=Enterococcus durans TaxID=53345 RepID=UPI0028905DB0|nr:hypothetical protein [Enterococcus durans]MDT2837990.1 hypothetical protein [Enterococcus durans]
MKTKILLFMIFLFSFFSFEKVHADASTLSFSDAPTIADYKRIRGVKNLQFVLFELARVYVGAPAANSWDELEERGRTNSSGLSLDKIAEFISDTNLTFTFTKFSYNLIMKSLETDYSVVDKNYFDSAGFYKPLNGASIQANKGFVIDIANLFNANVVYLTSRPLASGYEYDSYGNLWTNRIRFTVKSSKFADYVPTVGYSGSSSLASYKSLTVDSVSSDSVVYSLDGVGATKDISYLSVAQAYDEVSYPLRALSSLTASVDVGTAVKTVVGTGVVAKDVAVDDVLAFDERKVLSKLGEKVDGESLEKAISAIPGDKVDGDTDTDSDSNVGSIDKALTWLKEFFVPDFDGIQESFADFIDRLKNKFDFIFKLIDYIKSLFSSKKSLYDFYVVYRGEELYPFPKKWFGNYVPIFRNIANIFVFLWTCITIYKRFVGEGDAIAT